MALDSCGDSAPSQFVLYEPERPGKGALIETWRTAVIAARLGGMPSTRRGRVRHVFGSLLIQPQPVTTDVYDADGNLTSVTDPLQVNTAYQYNSLNEPAQVQVNGSPLLGPVYDKAGNEISDTDMQNGVVTDYKYDARDRLIEIDQPNATTGQTLDQNGHPLGPVTTFAYDLASNLTSVTDPLQNVTSFGYDNLDRLNSVTVPNPSTGGATGGLTTTGSYDLAGNLTSSTDPLGNTTSYAYDLQNNLRTTTDAAGGVTTYGHNAVGAVTSLTDSVGNTTSWQYDYLGREIQATDPLAHSSYYQYDANNNLTQATDRDGRVNVYGYDTLNRETVETWYNNANDAAAQQNSTGARSFSYDLDSRMTAASNTASPNSGGSPSTVATYNYQYNSAGFVTGKTVQLAGTPQILLGSKYDYDANRTSLAVNIGGTANYDGNGNFTGFSNGTADFINTYGYDFLANMTSIVQAGQGGNSVAAKSVALGYDADSRLTSTNLYNSTDTSVPVAASSYTYDHASRLTDLSYTAQGSTLAAYHWTYNNDSLVTDFYSRSDSSGTPTSSYTTWGHAQYNYNATQELSNLNGSGGSGGSGGSNAVIYSSWLHAPSSNVSLRYDSNGNRTANANLPRGTESAWATANLLTYDGTYYYTYDAEGNRVAKFKSSTGQLDSTSTNITTYQWNNANELVGLAQYTNYSTYQARNPASQVAYTYDAFGRMVSRSPVGGTAENYVYDGGNVALVLNGSGQVVERELDGPAVDMVLASENAATGVVSWLLTDNEGSVRDVARYANGTTSVVDHLVYDAFGQLTWQSSSSNQPRFTYAGMRSDAVSGLYYDNARWYDPANGVFIGQDPLGFAAGDTNLSRYCGNDPTNFVDPSRMSIMLPMPPSGPATGGASPAAVGVITSSPHSSNPKYPKPQKPPRYPKGASLYSIYLWNPSAMDSGLYTTSKITWGVAGAAGGGALGIGAGTVVAGVLVKGGVDCTIATAAGSFVGSTVGSTTGGTIGSMGGSGGQTIGAVGAGILGGMVQSPVCFVAGTPVLVPQAPSRAHAEPASRNIEDLRVGQRVVTNESNAASQEPVGTVVDTATWRKLVLRAEWRWQDGTLDDVNVETLQPPDWIAAQRAEVGATVPLPLDLVEMGLPADLTAEVLAVEPCPPIASGHGRVVLTTVNHLNPYVLELEFADGHGRTERVRPTGFHKFYSASRKDWISAENLRPGEELCGMAGRLGVVSLRAVPGVHRVYNMTVEDEHVYRVSEFGVLVHNVCRLAQLQENVSVTPYGQPLTDEQALNAGLDFEDLSCTTRSEAEDLATEISGGQTPIEDANQFHFHPVDQNGNKMPNHIFWGFW